MFHFFNKILFRHTIKKVKYKNRFYSTSENFGKLEWKRFRDDSTYLKKVKEEKEKKEEKEGKEGKEGKRKDEDSKKPLLHLSSEAINKLKEINLKHKGCKILKINVEAGGCSGFQYSFSLINKNQIKEKEIIAYNKEECTVLIDKVALDILKDSKIHYTNDLIARKFVIENIKNVSSKCSCGNSFDLNIK